MTSTAELLAAGRFLRLMRRGRWEYVDRTNSYGAAVLVAVTDDDHVILVEQDRPALGTRVIGLPAGLAGDIAGEEDEHISLAARRELVEETGYDAAQLTELTTCAASPGMSSELQTFFLATQLTKVGEGGGDDTEDIQVHRVPLNRAIGWLEDRKAADGVQVSTNVYAGLFFAALPR